MTASLRRWYLWVWREKDGLGHAGNVRRLDGEECAPPDITRDLSERALRLADSGLLAPADADALRAAVVNDRDDVPSFF